MALIVLDRPIGYDIGYVRCLFSQSGCEIMFKQNLTITGYPYETDHERFTGHWMYSMDGPFIKLEEERICYEISTSGEQSGSPIWAYFQFPDDIEGILCPLVVGIHTNGVIKERERDGNSGIRLTKSKFDFVKRWMEETGTVWEMINATFSENLPEPPLPPLRRLSQDNTAVSSKNGLTGKESPTGNQVAELPRGGMQSPKGHQSPGFPKKPAPVPPLCISKDSGAVSPKALVRDQESPRGKQGVESPRASMQSPKGHQSPGFPKKLAPVPPLRISKDSGAVSPKAGVRDQESPRGKQGIESPRGGMQSPKGYPSPGFPKKLAPVPPLRISKDSGAVSPKAGVRDQESPRGKQGIESPRGGMQSPKGYQSPVLPKKSAPVPPPRISKDSGAVSPKALVRDQEPSSDRQGAESPRGGMQSPKGIQFPAVGRPLPAPTQRSRQSYDDELPDYEKWLIDLEAGLDADLADRVLQSLKGTAPTPPKALATSAKIASSGHESPKDKRGIESLRVEPSLKDRQSQDVPKRPLPSPGLSHGAAVTSPKLATRGHESPKRQGAESPRAVASRKGSASPEAPKKPLPVLVPARVESPEPRELISRKSSTVARQSPELQQRTLSSVSTAKDDSRDRATKAIIRAKKLAMDRLSGSVSAQNQNNMTVSHTPSSVNDTSLHATTDEGRLQHVKQLLAQGVNIDAIDDSGRTALHFAAWQGCEKVVELLIEERANVSIVGPAGLQALHLATLKGHAGVANLLLSAGADVEAVCQIGPLIGNRVLHLAAMVGSRGTGAMMILLLKNGHRYGADIQALNNSGQTALHLAAEAGCAEAVELLLNRGVNVNVIDTFGQTALQLAPVNSEAAQILQRWIEAANNGPASQKMAIHGQESPKNMGGAESPRDLQSNGEGDSSAATTRKFTAVSAQQGQGARISSPSAELKKAARQENLEKIKSHAAAVKALAPTLHSAARAGLVKQVEKLLDEGVDVNLVENGYAALHLAAIAGHKEVVELLLSRGAEIDLLDDSGKTAFDLLWPESDVGRILQDAKRCLAESRASRSHSVLLRLLIQNGSVSKVEELIRRGIEVNSIGDRNNGDTGLHLAVRQGTRELIELFLERGADVLKLNSDGESPVMIALNAAGYDVKIIKLLVDAGMTAMLLLENKKALKGGLSTEDELKSDNYKKAFYVPLVSAIRDQQKEKVVLLLHHSYVLRRKGIKIEIPTHLLHPAAFYANDIEVVK